MELGGRVVVITGAGAGIGRASARRFAERGAILHLIDLDGDRVRDAAADCERLGGRATAHAADCRDPEALRRIAAGVPEVDVLFLNAGVGYGGRIADMTLDDWRFVLDTNLYGVVHGLDAFLRPMVSRGGGHILLTSSMLGLFSGPRAGAYAASKHALVGLGEALRAEMRRHHIEVTTLCPGLIATEIIRRGRMPAAERDRLEQRWSRGTDPDVVARIVVEDVEKGRGGLRLAAPAGGFLRHLRHFTPGLYARLLALGDRFY